MSTFIKNQKLSKLQIVETQTTTIANCELSSLVILGVSCLRACQMPEDKWKMQGFDIDKRLRSLNFVAGGRGLDHF